jgi:hypothetical protein
LVVILKLYLKEMFLSFPSLYSLNSKIFSKPSIRLFGNAEPPTIYSSSASCFFVDFSSWHHKYLTIWWNSISLCNFLVF